MVWRLQTTILRRLGGATSAGNSPKILASRGKDDDFIGNVEPSATFTAKSWPWGASNRIANQRTGA